MKFKVESIEKFPDYQKLTISTMVGKKKVKEIFSFSNEQILDDRWKAFVKQWIGQVNSKAKIVELEGKTFDLSK